MLKIDVLSLLCKVIYGAFPLVYRPQLHYALNPISGGLLIVLLLHNVCGPGLSLNQIGLHLQFLWYFSSMTIRLCL